MIDNYQKIVVTGCLIQEKKILLIQRSMNEKFYPGKYEMPWWKCDFDEQPVDSLIREYREETQLSISVWDVINTFAYVSDDNKRHTVEIVYLITNLDKSKEVKLSPKDHINYVWANEEELSNYFEDKNDPIYISIKKWFELNN